MHPRMTVLRLCTMLTRKIGDKYNLEFENRASITSYGNRTHTQRGMKVYNLIPYQITNQKQKKVKLYFQCLMFYDLLPLLLSILNHPAN